MAEPWRKIVTAFVVVAASLLAPVSFAKGVYLTVDEFLQGAFGEQQTGEQAYSVNKYWLTDQDRVVVNDILYRDLGLRLAYWRQGDRTAWVFDEIGKTEPITIGVVVEGGSEKAQVRIVEVQILEFRESRGWEVKYASFRDQFVGVFLESKSHKLSRPIDGVTGATLSVNAVKKIARLALYFHQQLVNEGAAAA